MAKMRIEASGICHSDVLTKDGLPLEMMRSDQAPLLPDAIR